MQEKIYKEVENYSDNVNNYVVEKELTVTITLREYRELISNNATRDHAIQMAEKDKYERNNENQKLKEEICKLKTENYELNKKLYVPIEACENKVESCENNEKEGEE